MAERIQVGDKWYVAATALNAGERTQVLKNEDAFALFDRFGDVHSLGLGEHGLYYDDTRFLSLQEVLIDGQRPLFLNALVKEHNSLLIVESMNPDLMQSSGQLLQKGSVHFFRAKLLWNAACHEHFRITNHGIEPVSFTMSLDFDADYVDLFEVRGNIRQKRGERHAAQVGDNEVRFSYTGLDQIMRTTLLRFTPAPSSLSANRATFDIQLAPHEEAHLYLTVECLIDNKPKAPCPDYLTAFRHSEAERTSLLTAQCLIGTSNPLFNLWIDRSASDIAMLTTHLRDGPYPYAGVPWYSTTFGRDGILTAWEMLWANPSQAKGVLGFLASTQATKEERSRDAEPGKILHEARRCEMALTGEIPFGRYYGSVDSTPLFVGLANAYHERTNDTRFIQTLWPNILLALEWIDRYGDSDGDGFVEYKRHSDDGLIQQGWKDSTDSVFHRDGSLAAAPIALCEVQGYVYQAKLGAGRLSEVLGDHALAAKLYAQAAQLKQRFQELFWCKSLGTYALALDGNKQPCEVLSSNAGHTLWSGIAAPEHAASIAQVMLSPAFFSGWGVRTIAEGQSRYNPMSYHNGSIWPHDNALIAAGMARYGMTQHALAVLNGMYDASLFFDQHRLPELFCGFPRRATEGPTLYPVACSPQAWAAATVFSLIQSCLGLECDAGKKQIKLTQPMLPACLDSLTVRELTVGDASVDLLFTRHGNNVGAEVLNKRGNVEVLVAM